MTTEGNFSDPQAELNRLQIENASLRLANLGLAHWAGSEHQRANHEHQLARRDTLSGLLNRRGMSEELNQLHDRGVTHGVVLMDLCAFKGVNDLLSYDTGDAVIRLVSGIINRETRDHDQLCTRHGGDEFAVIIPDMTANKMVGDERQNRRSAPADASEFAGRVSLVATRLLQAVTKEPVIADYNAKVLRHWPQFHLGLKVNSAVSEPPNAFTPDELLHAAQPPVSTHERNYGVAGPLNPELIEEFHARFTAEADKLAAANRQ